MKDSLQEMDERRFQADYLKGLGSLMEHLWTGVLLRGIRGFPPKYRPLKMKRLVS